MHQVEEKNWSFHDYGYDFVRMMFEFSEEHEATSAISAVHGERWQEQAFRGYVGFETAKISIFMTAFGSLLIFLVEYDYANTWSLCPLSIFLCYALSDALYVHFRRAISGGISHQNPGLITAILSAPLLVSTLLTLAGQIRARRNRLVCSAMSLLLAACQGYAAFVCVVANVDGKINYAQHLLCLFIIFPCSTAVACSMAIFNCFQFVILPDRADHQCASERKSLHSL